MNSPTTMASVRNAPLSSATRRFGRIDLQDDPRPAGAQALGRLGQAPDVDRLETGVDRPVHVREGQDHVGRDEQDVAAHVGVRSAAAAAWLNVEIRPKTRMIGGMTNGRSVMNSTTGRARGTFSRTQYAVGTMSPRLTMIVTMPDDERSRSGSPQKPGLARMRRRRRFAARLSVATSGSTKYRIAER